MDVKFIVLEGKGVDRHELPFSGSEFLIGRSAACNLAIDHSRVSLEHCRIARRDDGRIILEDLHSTYGTFLNNHDIEIAALHDGDLLRIGPITLLCAFGAEASATRRRVLEEYEARAHAVASAPPSRSLHDPNEDSPAVTTARQIFTRLAGQPEPSSDETDVDTTRPADREAPRPKPQSERYRRLQIQEDDGVAMVNLIDHAIIHEFEIQQIAAELDALIETGQRRILIDFGNVRHMSSQAVGVLIRAQKTLKSLGGLLKLCNPNPEVAEVFKITNLPKAIEIHVDESAALRAGWPDTAADSPAAHAVEVAQAAADLIPKARPPAPASHAPGAADQVPGPAPLKVRLIIQVGKSAGKAIPIPGPIFVIGRDARCQLRPASESISRTHTRIALRQGRVFVRDLGTTNGTILGQRLLHGEEAEAHDGDLLQVGPLKFTFAIAGGEQPEPAPQPIKGNIEEAAASWLFETGAVGLGDTAFFPMPALDASFPARQRALNEIRRTKHQVVGETTVVILLAPVLLDEDQIGPVRHELISLLDQPVPHRLVICLDRVTEISSLAIAMLLGHHQRLDRLGGGLRLCQANNEVAAMLESGLVSTSVQLFPTAEAALREPWPIT